MGVALHSGRPRSGSYSHHRPATTAQRTHTQRAHAANNKHGDQDEDHHPGAEHSRRPPAARALPHRRERRAQAGGRRRRAGGGAGDLAGPVPARAHQERRAGPDRARSPMVGFVAGKVLESKADGWVAGDLFGAMLPFSTVQVITAEALKQTTMWKLTGFIDESQISLGLGVLGMPGSTVYAGMDILRPNEGETLFVSGAAGAVGSMVGQVAKHVYKCKVVGSCGGEEKAKLIKEKFGFDEAVDYKKAKDAAELKALLHAAAPDGIDMYYENVGGIHFDAAFQSLRPRGRIAICGSISNYNSKERATNAIAIHEMIYTQQRIEGFVCFEWLAGKRGNFLPTVHQWWKDGSIKVEETTFEGIDKWIDAFQALFTGANKGKVVLRV